MITSITAQSKVAVIFTGQRITRSICYWRGRDLSTIGSTCAWSRRAISVITAETAQADIVPWASASYADGGTGWARTRCC